MEIQVRIQKHFNNGFRKLGTFVCIHSKLAIIVPVITTLVLALGILNYKIITNFDYLFAPANCRAYYETETLSSLFPINSSSNFDPVRAIDHGRYGSILFMVEDNDTILTEHIFKEIRSIDQLIRSIHIEYNNQVYNYSSLCARNEGKCFTNEIFTIDDIRLIEAKRKVLKFPAYVSSDLLTYKISAINLGGVITDKEGNVLKAKAFRLNYHLDNSDPIKDHLAEMWEEQFIKAVSNIESDRVIIAKFISTTFHVEVWKFVNEVIKLAWISNLIFVLFTVVTCMTTDWVTSKPLLGVCGFFSVFLAIVSCFGIMMAFGVPCAPVNVIVPFVILGVGMDDSFVLIAAWRRTDSKQSVVKRMEEAYSEAAGSITVTSLTNLLSFCIGLLTPFPATKIICAYLAVGIIFDFIYQITFFGGCMALDGYREKNGLHPITLKPVLSTEETTNRGHLYHLLFTDKVQHEDKPHVVMVWFRDYLGDWIGTKWGRCIILLTFIAYLSGAGWNVTFLTEGLDVTNIFPRNSYGNPYMYYHYRYFTQYPFTIQVVINATLDYSYPEVQKQVFELMDRFHDSPYVADYHTDWLYYYLKFIKHKNSWIFHKMYNFSNSEDFVGFLRDVFLRHPEGKVFSQDLLFSEDGKNIVASRFVLIAEGVSSLSSEKAALVNLRSIADSSAFPVTAQCKWWINHEQFLVTKHLAISCITGSVILVAFVLLIFTGNPTAMVSGMLAMLSTEFGLVGYMPAWGLRLNSLSLIILITCVGCSVDYSSHITYAYMTAKGLYKDRIKHAIFAAGMPITQCCFSSIIAVSVLAAGSFIAQTFFKITLMLFVFAFFHSIFLLPTFLSICDMALQCIKSPVNQKSKAFLEVPLPKGNLQEDT